MPGTTGRYLILMEPESIDTATKALEREAGLQVFSSQDTHDVGHVLPFGSDGAIVFESLGIAVVTATEAREATASAVAASEGSITLVEAERYVYATGTVEVDLSYLLGYRDAIDDLVGRIGGSKGAPRRVEAELIDGPDFTWGLVATKVDQASRSGRGVRVAVLDTGIDLDHPDFIGRVHSSQSFVEGSATAQDLNGHGTHCAGIACGPSSSRKQLRYGVAPDAELLVGKVLDDRGRGTDGSILAGIQWAMENRCHIVSMSLGAPVSETQPWSRIFQRAADRARAQGTLLIAAAGNDSRRPDILRPVSHPANCPGFVAVGAVDRRLKPASFSNAGIVGSGGSIDICAPGVDIYSSWIQPDEFRAISGTSMATPHIAGIAALWAEARGGDLDADALLERVLQSAKRLSSSTRDVGIGLGQAPG